MGYKFFYEDFQGKTPDEIKESAAFLKDLLETDKRYILKTLSQSNGEYAVVKPGQDAIYMDKADASVKAETERYVKSFLDGATFITENSNNLDDNDCRIKEEITEATKDKFKTTAVIDRGEDRLFILY